MGLLFGVESCEQHLSKHLPLSALNLGATIMQALLVLITLILREN